MAKAATKKDTALNEQSIDDLKALIASKQADLIGYKKGLIIGELKNTHVIKSTRKEIAQIKTALNGKEGEK